MKKKKESKEQQLQFGLKDTPKNIYFKYKDQYEVWLAGLETRKYVKDPLTWFTLVMSITFLITEISILESSTRIPSKIPLFNYYIAPIERLVVKDLAYLYPFLSLLIIVISVYLSNLYYHKERELSKTLLIVMLISSLSLCLIFLNLFYSFY